MSEVTLLLGDCLDRMAEMPESSIDSIITDPPYGLSFLCRSWDKIAPGRETWEAALRVAKPGAHLVAFGGTRTFHRLTCAIEDAGWEVRDCLMWLHAQGMPKGQDISKQFDKMAGAEREVIGTKIGLPGYSDKPSDRSPGYMEGWSGPEAECAITAPATDIAKRWAGWNTQLKPSWEPILLCRKPMKQTVARNVAEHGCGALNVDGCRVGTGEDRANGGRSSGSAFGLINDDSWRATAGLARPTGGRWPANAILDEAAARLLDEMAGERTSGKHKNVESGIGGYNRDFRGSYKTPEHYGDSGGVSRFFYCSKASPSERAGSAHPTMKPVALMRWLCRLVNPPGGVVLDPFAGSASTGVACLDEGMRFVGVELDPDYLAMAEARIAAHRASMPLLAGVAP